MDVVRALHMSTLKEIILFKSNKGCNLIQEFSTYQILRLS